MAKYRWGQYLYMSWFLFLLLVFSRFDITLICHSCSFVCCLLVYHSRHACSCMTSWQFAKQSIIAVGLVPMQLSAAPVTKDVGWFDLSFLSLTFPYLEYQITLWKWLTSLAWELATHDATKVTLNSCCTGKVALCCMLLDSRTNSLIGLVNYPATWLLS